MSMAFSKKHNARHYQWQNRREAAVLASGAWLGYVLI